MPDVESKPPPSPVVPAEPAAEPAAGADAPPADPLARLKKMSTTAGVGTGDYVAINPVAVASFLLGLASLAVLLSDVLLVVPLAGVVCAVIAWRQVRNSNGTQTGTGLAAAGLLLSLLIGGGVFGSRVVVAWARHNDEQEMVGAARQLGQQLAARQLDQAYQHFGPRFRERIARMRFAGPDEAWAKVGADERDRRAVDNFRRTFTADGQQGWEVGGGGIRALEWNGQVIWPDDAADAGAQVAWVGILPEFEQPIPTKPRWQLKFVKEGGTWLIEDFPDIFPPERKPKAPR